jgi:hypothetical protein
LGTLFSNFLPNTNLITGLNGPSVEKVKTVVEKYLLPGKTVEIKDIKTFGNISEAKVSFMGQELPIFVSNDGEHYFQQVLDVKKMEVKKTDKPEVELFVMSHCPFGTQAEKGYLPAVEKLGDKINARVRFVNYVMHPAQGEGEENMLQYCIQETVPEKFNSYLGCFLEAGKTDDCLAKNNISKDSLKSCLETTDAKYSVSKNIKDKKS